MKFVTYVHNGEEYPGVLSQDECKVIPLKEGSLIEFIRNHTEKDMDELRMKISDNTEGFEIGQVRLTAPIPRPIHDVICVGVNYADHSDEINKGRDTISLEAHRTKTIYFGKRASRILGPEETLEPPFALDDKLDYETELAVVIGKSGRDLSSDEVESHIFGYAVFNDFSSRGLQKEHTQWLCGKSLDGYTAMGPYIVTLDEFETFPPELDLSTEVNGEIRQSSNTRNMINPVHGIIAEFSQGITLEAGDIFATGTPSGVALGMSEPKYLVSGDVVVSKIQGLGELVTKVE